MHTHLFGLQKYSFVLYTDSDIENPVMAIKRANYLLKLLLLLLLIDAALQLQTTLDSLLPSNLEP